MVSGIVGLRNDQEKAPLTSTALARLSFPGGGGVASDDVESDRPDRVGEAVDGDRVEGALAGDEGDPALNRAGAAAVVVPDVTSVRPLTAEPVYAASTVSKGEPQVVIVTNLSVESWSLYQTEFSGSAV